MNSGKNTANHRNKRRLRVIKPRSQWRLIWMAVAAVFAVSAIVTVQSFGVFYHHARSIAIGSESIGDATTMLVVQACLAAVAPAIAVGFLTLLFTHRIFGPVAVLEHFVGEFAQGRFPKRRPLRKKDELKTLHALVCDAIDYHEERTKNEQARRDALRSELARIRSEAQGAADLAWIERLSHLLDANEPVCEQSNIEVST